jgi:hypothetical protein
MLAARCCQSCSACPCPTCSVLPGLRRGSNLDHQARPFLCWARCDPLLFRWPFTLKAVSLLHMADSTSPNMRDKASISKLLISRTTFLQNLLCSLPLQFDLNPFLASCAFSVFTRSFSAPHLGYTFRTGVDMSPTSPGT